jgi:photosynthetic reaction center cytochrome c subunit
MTMRTGRTPSSSALYSTVFAFGLAGLCVPLSSGQATNAASPKTTEQAFKNIQVLKGLPAEQLIPSMQFISASLGVECDYCHVQNAFDKDDKKSKPIARKMIQMMFAINKDNFEGDLQLVPPRRPASRRDSCGCW